MDILPPEKLMERFFEVKVFSEEPKVIELPKQEIKVGDFVRCLDYDLGCLNGMGQVVEVWQYNIKVDCCFPHGVYITPSLDRVEKML